jgi:hypothetical protein
MVRADREHAEFVASWIDGTASQLDAASLVAMIARATSAVWRRARLVLGEVTLQAIAGRVIRDSSEKYPFLSALRLDGAGGISFQDLGKGAALPDAGQLQEGLEFVLVEFLTVLGSLTGEILTPALHAEIRKVHRSEEQP